MFCFIVSRLSIYGVLCFFFKQKTAYEMRISDWSSDVCSSDLLVPRGILALFSAFIVLCGMTHLFSVWVLWTPDYGAEGLVKAATAVVSLATAISLVPALRWARLVPSAGQWMGLNDMLNREVADRRAAEAQVRALNADLENRLRARTAELEATNRQLRT